MRADPGRANASKLYRLVRSLWFIAAANAPTQITEEDEMPNPAPGFKSRPDHRVDLVPEGRRVRVVFGGIVIADSRTALRVEETDHAAVHYVPEKDVRLDLMHRA